MKRLISIILLLSISVVHASSYLGKTTEGSSVYLENMGEFHHFCLQMISDSDGKEIQKECVNGNISGFNAFDYSEGKGYDEVTKQEVQSAKKAIQGNLVKFLGSQTHSRNKFLMNRIAHEYAIVSFGEEKECLSIIAHKTYQSNYHSRTADNSLKDRMYLAQTLTFSATFSKDASFSPVKRKKTICWNPKL